MLPPPVGELQRCCGIHPRNMLVHLRQQSAPLPRQSSRTVPPTLPLIYRLLAQPFPWAAAADNVLEVGGRTIVVEEDGTIIISQPSASDKAVDVKDSTEVQYLTGERDRGREGEQQGLQKTAAARVLYCSAGEQVARWQAAPGALVHA